MIGETFLNRVTNAQTDALALLLGLLEQTGAKHCVIGGLAVNAYAEPVVSLDLDIVIVTDKVQSLCEAANSKGITIERFEHSINLSVPGSDLRIQIQTDPRYQEFITQAAPHDGLGYMMAVAALEGVLRHSATQEQPPGRSGRHSPRDRGLSRVQGTGPAGHPRAGGMIRPLGRRSITPSLLRRSGRCR
jgi:hypothetical protein